MTPAPVPGNIEEALDLFRAQFAGQLPGRLAEAQGALDAWRAAPADDESLRTLHRVLHRLAGSAGTFGMPAFGEACRAIELRLEAMLEGGARTPQDMDTISREVAALQDVKG